MRNFLFFLIRCAVKAKYITALFFKFYSLFSGIPSEKKQSDLLSEKSVWTLLSAKVEFGLDLEIDMEVSIICVESGRARWRGHDLALQSESNQAQLSRKSRVYMLFSENRSLCFFGA